MKIKLSMQQVIQVVGVFFLFVGAGNSTFGNISGGAACFAAGILLILLFSFDVKQFNVFGLAAELKDKISEADKILESLRGISLPVSEIAIKNAAQAGRYDLIVPRKKLYEFVNSISRELEGMGVKVEDIERVRDEWYLATAIDMALPVHREIQKQIDFYHSQAINKNSDINYGKVILNDEEAKDFYEHLGNIEWDRHHYYSEVVSDINPNYKDYPQYLQKIITDLTGVPESVKAQMLIKTNEHILDIEYLINQKDIRRPDVWFK
ncbi:hypothetical protein HP563_12655 [Pantoea dispersa]|uniref:hypothetical protein n=1 Tax=Pantoea dispersa TaxID=59814 RepID=UPI00352995A4